MGAPDAYAGELPVAFVTLKPGVAVSAEALLAEVAPQVYERPATPKRLTLLDAMPMTAIGKIYKPTLRLRAVEAKLADMLTDVPGAVVRGEERGGSLCAVVSIPTAPDPMLETRLREQLAAIAVPVSFVFAQTPGE